MKRTLIPGAGLYKEFRDFLFKRNALALAVGVVAGSALTNVVNGVVTDLIMPVAALLTPAGEWRRAGIQIGVSARGEPITLLLGDLVGRVIDFVVVSLVIFFIVKVFLREELAAPGRVKTCPNCLELVPMAATRCRACTSQL